MDVGGGGGLGLRGEKKMEIGCVAVISNGYITDLLNF